jgi:UDP-N-acetylglucosamine diphosphorylase / glucose-1-phosphate thymidylyltransferase / UDP-N-acetylgalactosamine diphosphorylase / glucosamine-1-phosphate N-acetyltransferase / galactosamine-1-phosphate N-acetyltransferase
MQAVIMAAGRSTRTHPLTATRPKPLVPIWDRPLLEHQLRQLDGLVDEVLLVVGFLREQIEGRFGDAFGGMRLRYVVQELQRGTADALLAARPHVTARCLVLNGDDFYHEDDLRGLAESGRGLLVTQAKDPENRAVVRLEADVVTGIVEKPKDPPKDAWCSVGGYCVEKDDLRYLDDVVPSPRGELELPDFILRLVEESVVHAKRIDRFWLPITYSWDVLQAALFFWEDPARARELGLVSETLSAIQARGDVTLGQNVRIEGPIRLGANVRIEDGVRLVGPIAIGSGTDIAKGAMIERSILFDDVVVGADARILDSVLGDGVSIGAAARIESRPGSELTIDVKGKRVVPEIPRLGVVAGDGVSIEAGAVVPAGTLI